MSTFFEIFCGTKDNVVFAINKTLQTKNVKIAHINVDASGNVYPNHQGRTYEKTNQKR